jgi:hypothetical protein
MRLRNLLAVTAIALGACAHDEPFQPSDTTTDRPFAPGTPTRLTYNPGADLHVAWLPDGSAFLYAWQQYAEPDLDRCIGMMAATGGTRTRTICNTNPASVDSADLFDVPSPAPAGGLLYLRTTSRPGAASPDHGGVFFAPLADPLAARPVIPLPYAIPGGRTYGSLSTASWLGPKRLVAVGQSVVYSKECDGCLLDTLVTGLELLELNLAGAQALLAVVPLTDGASSAALTPSGDTLYFTVNGDSRIQRLVLPTGQLSTAHDFGALGIARDVTVHDATLVAVVGGEVEYTDDPTLGPLQVDGGGSLMAVNLATGVESALSADTTKRFRRPQFAPGGGPTRLVVEVYPPSIFPPPPQGRHAVVGKPGDLYLFVSP